MNSAQEKSIIPASQEPLGLQWSGEISNRATKEELATRVAARAKDGEVIGAGSGSTAFLTVQALGRRAESDALTISVVPTSIEIAMACRAVGLTTVNGLAKRIDWCFDGADEVDPQGRLLKGRGGALYRERVVFEASNNILVVADDSKSVERLGENFAVPVEVEAQWLEHAYNELYQLDHVASVKLRMAVGKDGPVITESGRVLLDVSMTLIDDDDEAQILAIAGVCCTGIFSGFTFERIS